MAARVRDSTPFDAAEMLSELTPAQAASVANLLDPAPAAAVLAAMHPQLAAAVVVEMEAGKAATTLGKMNPDDRVDVMQQLPRSLHEALLRGMEEFDVAQVRRLEVYPADTAGGVMTTEAVALPHHLTVDQGIAELRQRREQRERTEYVYVVDHAGHLLGVLSMRELIFADPHTTLRNVMHSVISVPVDTDQEEVARQMRRHNYLALPVVDGQRRLLGQVTADDLADVVEEEATEDIQKLGGSNALDAPYLITGFGAMIRKRGGWLTILFLGEMLTATAMRRYEDMIARAVVLALFVPLIISSGGNSGSQAATIVVRSLALSELKLHDWWRVLLREVRSSATLGAWLGLLGFARIALWQHMGWIDYGPHYLRLGLSIWLSLLGVVTFGSISGSMLPFVLSRLRLDPATSSAPFVATLVDVSGLVIYFSIAGMILRGSLL
jgi:magnesium transporter